MSKSVHSTLRGCLLVALGAMAAYTTTAGADQKVPPTQSDQTNKVHKIDYPRIDPRVGGPCSAEAAAYLAAVDDLTAAQQAADDAYYAWMICVNTGKATKSGAEQLNEAPKHSVLIKD